jgi:iron complex outermembrane receptor protein
MTSARILLLGISPLAFVAPAYAQESAPAQQANIEAESETGAAESNDIIVTARRRDERLQDVPTTVNVVTAAEIDKLNLRNFTDIQNVVPGLTLTSNGSFSNSATVRGVQFTPEANGNNATVEFYLNEAPISSAFVFQSMFDIGQFELLRGPQGTLRGRASPSGSITVTTRRPNLHEAGVVANLTYTDTNSFKGDFAFNVPIIQDVLGIRLAGVYNTSEGSQVRSIRAASDPAHFPDPYSRMEGIRASATFEPTDWASFQFMYQGIRSRNLGYGQVASASFAPTPRPGTIVEPIVITPTDRLAIGNPGAGGSDQNVYVGNITLRFAGQKLSYVGSYNTQRIYSLGGSDAADYFGPPRFALVDRAIADQAGQYPACVENVRATGLPISSDDFYQCTLSRGIRKSHEVRLSSEERLGGMFDYVVGALYDHNDNPTRLTTENPAVTSVNPPGNTQLVTPLSLRTTIRDSQSTERSIFGNVVAHVGDHLELSGGLRYIHYQDESALIIPGSINFPRKNDYTATIYSGSIKYRLNENLMFYGSIGTSWRPGAFAVGDFSVNQSPAETRFTQTDPETSKSYELGLRSSFLNNRGRLNLSVYQQDFDNYVYRANPGVLYVNYRTATSRVPSNFNFIAGVPARVRGIEADASFQILPRWSISGNFAYADGKIINGTIPCTDLDRNNIPDLNPTTPANADALAALLPAGENLAQCTGYNGRLLNVPKWNMSMQSEAGFTLTGNADGFVRGLMTYRPATENDPNNTNDDVGGFALFNLYAGIRHPEGRWELTAFAKNIFNTQKILSFGGSPISQSVPVGNSSFLHPTGYYSVSVTAPREVGVTFHAAFGSR